MITLKKLLENMEQGLYYDWTKDFNSFKQTTDSATEWAKAKFQKALSAKVMGKSVVVRGSRGYKQPVKDYKIDQVTGVDINDYYDNWVVVLKNKSGKEYFLNPGFKLQVVSGETSPEPAAADAPQAPQPKPQTPVPQPKPGTTPQQPVQPEQPQSK